jgi:flagellar biogenesis protein FliO
MKFEGAVDRMEFVSQMVAVAAVLGLLGASLWWLRRRGYGAMAPVRRGAGRRMECLERLPLGPQHTLHLIRLGEKALLVACSPAGCALVESMPCGEVDTRREGHS